MLPLFVLVRTSPGQEPISGKNARSSVQLLSGLSFTRFGVLHLRHVETKTVVRRNIKAKPLLSELGIEISHHSRPASAKPEPRLESVIYVGFLGIRATRPAAIAGGELLNDIVVPRPRHWAGHPKYSGLSYPLMVAVMRSGRPMSHCVPVLEGLRRYD